MKLLTKILTILMMVFAGALNAAAAQEGSHDSEALNPKEIIFEHLGDA